MSLRSKMKTSPRLETGGVTLEIDNTKVLLARAGGTNQKYNAAIAKWAAANKRAVNLELIDNEKFRDTLIEFYADTIVLDWHTDIVADPYAEDWVQGIEGEDGGVVPFNRENVIAYFKEVPDFFNECKLFAESGQNYRQSILDAALGK